MNAERRKVGETAFERLEEGIADRNSMQAMTMTMNSLAETQTHRHTDQNPTAYAEPFTLEIPVDPTRSQSRIGTVIFLRPSSSQSLAMRADQPVPSLGSHRESHRLGGTFTLGIPPIPPDPTRKFSPPSGTTWWPREGALSEFPSLALLIQ